MSIQIKFFILFAFVSLALFVMIGYVLYGLRLISTSSEVITDVEIPLRRGIDGALLAILDGKFSLEAALSIDESSEIARVTSREADLNNSILLFDMYVAAVTWGSESEAFKKSGEGVNFEQWQKLGLEKDLVIKKQSERERQLAGVTNLYFGGFAANALKAIASHKEFLSAETRGGASLSAAKSDLAAQVSTRRHKNNALKFSGLAIESLSGIVDLSNSSIIASSLDIRATQNTVRRNILFIFAIGFFVSAYAVFVFTRRSIIGPLTSLTMVAQKITAGNLAIRAKIKSRDEIGMLARAFNKMTTRLAEYPLELERTVQERTSNLTRLNQTLKISNKKIEERNRELDKVAKALVKRDLEFSGVRRKQEDQLIELDKSAKALVRRDMDLLRLNDELEELDRAKSHFVSVAAHQLRTPLSIIKWTFRMLLSGDFGKINEEQKNVIQRGYDVNEGTIRLISDLLDVARIEAGRFSYSFNTVDIEKIIKDVVEMNGPRAKEKKIDITISKGAGSKIPSTKADEAALQVVLQNLLSNAINYTLPGGKIELVYKKKGKFIEVRVKDTGVGIPQRQMSRIFTKFFRGDNVIRMQTSGTGLGLFIAKNIITAHKGEMGVESQEGKGSTFWFRIPIKS